MTDAEATIPILAESATQGFIAPRATASADSPMDSPDAHVFLDVHRQIGFKFSPDRRAVWFAIRIARLTSTSRRSSSIFSRLQHERKSRRRTWYKQNRASRNAAYGEISPVRVSLRFNPPDCNLWPCARSALRVAIELIVAPSQTPRRANRWIR